MKKRACNLTVAAFLALFCYVPAALAHSFNLVILAPQNADLRQVMRQAFLIASGERDSHPAQESDGHLGGLDVYLGFADDTATPMPDPDIIADPLGGHDVADLADTRKTVWLGPTDPTTDAALSMLATALDPALVPFAKAFLDATGQVPDHVAVATYLAARRVDLAVRALGGTEDKDALRDLLSD